MINQTLSTFFPRIYWPFVWDISDYVLHLCRETLSKTDFIAKNVQTGRSDTDE